MNSISVLPHKCSLSTFLCLLFLLCVSAHLAIGQQVQTRPTQPSASYHPHPLSLPQLYWAFLSYQSRLDTLAAQREAQGKDGSWIRNDLQTRLGFTDAEYAPIRTASQRFNSELTQLNKLAKQAKATGSTPSLAQSQARTAMNNQCKADLDNEIYNLSQELSPKNKAALEKFMTKFFAPKKISFRAPVSGLSAGEAVRK